MTISRSLAIVLLLVGCQAAERPEAEIAGAAEAASVTAADFRTIRWIEGTWRGTGGGVEPFVERYRLVDDSTLLRETFTDSSLSSIGDSALIVLRGSRVVEPAEDPRWQVTAFDSSSWRFESLERPGHAFTWRMEAPDRWTADLESRDASGAPQTRMYTLERLRP